MAQDHSTRQGAATLSESKRGWLIVVQACGAACADCCARWQSRDLSPQPQIKLGAKGSSDAAAYQEKQQVV